MTGGHDMGSRWELFEVNYGNTKDVLEDNQVSKLSGHWTLSPVLVTPVENIVPIPVLPPSSGPRHTVVESSTTLQLVSVEEEWEIEDRLVRAWQRQGAIVCVVPIETLTLEQLQTQSLGARGYQMLSVMRVVTLMPNMTVSACLLSSDHEEFDSLLSGELEAEVHPIVVQDVVWSGAKDDKLEYSDGWVTDHSVENVE
ncbi:hypothetical protein BDM02DRAFT_3132665 [Thelephora ganbajun]|uniref:Uncharacterized protein n=1 Tax=Thelephora ganbajun TaxID=370292 RepID=A0ACB6Z0S4_THEGA|nr:hypothetical protein BDM02DRAFT_3132665 [Thelephora ganbajun]